MTISSDALKRGQVLAAQRSRRREHVKWLLRVWRQGDGTEGQLPPMMGDRHQFLERGPGREQFVDPETNHETGIPTEPTVRGTETPSSRGSQPVTLEALHDTMRTLKRVMAELKDHPFGPDFYLSAYHWAAPMTLEDVAVVMGVSKATVERKFEAALLYIQGALDWAERGRLYLTTQEDRW